MHAHIMSPFGLPEEKVFSPVDSFCNVPLRVLWGRCRSEEKMFVEQSLRFLE